MTLVDSNVLLDVMIVGQHWAKWSERQLDLASSQGPLIINDVVYAEISARFIEIEILDERLAKNAITIAQMPRMALFLAGKTFLRYKAAGGVRTGVLPDFFIGAHAVAENVPLLTRDRRRYRTYFPYLTLIAPDDPKV